MRQCHPSAARAPTRVRGQARRARRDDTDPTRVAAQVVTGIGFLGAGAILRDGGSVKGLTTAASLWVTAAVGLACGLGSLAVAGIATLIALKRLERGVFPQRRGRVVELRLDREGALAEAADRASDVLGGKAVVERVGPAAEGRDAAGPAVAGAARFHRHRPRHPAARPARRHRRRHQRLSVDLRGRSGR